jgi:hypothetical protein
MLRLTLLLAARKSLPTSHILSAIALITYRSIVFVVFGSVWSELLRFQVSKPQNSDDNAFQKLLSLTISQLITALCSVSSCYGE